MSPVKGSKIKIDDGKDKIDYYKYTSMLATTIAQAQEWWMTNDYKTGDRGLKLSEVNFGYRWFHGPITPSRPS
jgi:hypothetical protein